MPARSPGSAIADGRPDEDDRRRRQQVQRRELDLAAAELLAEVLRCSPDHQSGDEHRDHGEHEDAVQTRTRCRRARSRRASCSATSSRRRGWCTSRGSCRPLRSRSTSSPSRRRSSRARRTGSRCLRSHAPTAVGTVPWCATWKTSISTTLATASTRHHRRRSPVPARRSPTMPAERARQRERDAQQQEDLQPVRPRRRVLERVGGVRVVEPAAVRAEFLDGLLARDRPAGDRLRAARDRVHRLVVGEVLHHAGARRTRSRTRSRAAAGCGRRCGSGRPRSCRAGRCGCARSRAPARRRRRCRPRRTRSSARPGRPSARHSRARSRPSRTASSCW